METEDDLVMDDFLVEMEDDTLVEVTEDALAKPEADTLVDEVWKVLVEAEDEGSADATEVGLVEAEDETGVEAARDANRAGTSSEERIIKDEGNVVKRLYCCWYSGVVEVWARPKIFKSRRYI